MNEKLKVNVPPTIETLTNTHKPRIYAVGLQKRGRQLGIPVRLSIFAFATSAFPASAPEGDVCLTNALFLF